MANYKKKYRDSFMGNDLAQRGIGRLIFGRKNAWMCHMNNILVIENRYDRSGCIVMTNQNKANRNCEEKLASGCDFSGIKPAVMDLPYPPLQVRERNKNYAELIGISYCGMVSELSACLQYINNESRMVNRGCAMGRTLLGMAVAEMQHMQMLAGLIDLLGGNVCYTTGQAGGQTWMWSPQCLTLPEEPSEMLRADLDREIAVIDQYQSHMRLIGDDYVTAVLGRIVQDEQYHIMLLRSMMDTM